MPALIRMVRPDPGQTIGLQFDAYLDTVCLNAIAAGALRGLRLRQDAKQVLHVMTDFVRDHIGLRKFTSFSAAASEADLYVTKKRGIEIDAPVVGAIERTHRGLRETATALYRS